MTNVTFRNVEDEVLREFKAEAVREGKTLGEALVEALLNWLQSRQAKKAVKFTSLKPIDFGKNSEKSSNEIDEIVYG